MGTGPSREHVGADSDVARCNRSVALVGHGGFPFLISTGYHPSGAENQVLIVDTLPLRHQITGFSGVPDGPRAISPRGAAGLRGLVKMRKRQMHKTSSQ